MEPIDISHRHFDECGSTNDLAREWALHPNDPAVEGSIVTADHQTHGRGRRGRVWRSGAGENLLMSIVLRPTYPLADFGQLAIVTAVGVADALEAFGVLPALKWPNDVLVDGRKIAGILVEAASDGAGWVGIVGVGVNVNQMDFTDDNNGDDPGYELAPTSLALALGDEVPVVGVCEAVRRRILAREDEHRTRGFHVTASAWRGRMAIGQQVRSGAHVGIQEFLLDDGEINVRLPDGSVARWGTVS